MEQNKLTDSAKVYTKSFLPIYDLYVLKFSNTFVWKCPSSKLQEFYNINISHNHLDVGAGTGYFMDHARFLDKPNIGLLDSNPNSLAAAAHRIRRYQPTCYQADIMQPLQLPMPKFDTISLNYLLHCLPGNFYDKEIVFKNVVPLLNPHGVVFGSTILGDKSKANWLAKKLLDIYNAKGFFGNLNDNLQDLEQVLARNFQTYTVYQIGMVATFIGRIG